ncbi:Hypothetical predicted protein [Mytilus galloprovincialis]|uniref:Mab-21-like HhH/H2TH-like domain-containing protein n=1 Tax=Mytilus galloprovincialis TaxID=29158 RepID=A0A8B6E212_MYTGA|nr:Hypothetical predicted protein [Mytilus galloprovincialis]
MLVTKRRTASLAINEVLDGIGASDNARRRRQFKTKLTEAAMNVTIKCLAESSAFYSFGSHSEGATTFDMNSDIDQVVCPTNCIVIQNMSDWVPKKQCYLIVADELSFPGYVKLQRLKTDKPEPYIALDSLHAIDQHGRIVLRNTCFKDLTNMPKFDQHGPAFTYHEEPGFQSRDVVFALLVPKYRMQTCIWSRQSRQQTLSPTETCQALVVAVCHPFSSDKELEWRLSFSFLEQRFIHSLNDTQMKCYILLKMIKGTFIQPVIGDSLSSFHCKNSIFYLSTETNKSFWRPVNILSCLHLLLRRILEWVEAENCPHYFKKDENLFNNKIEGLVRCKLEFILHRLLRDEGKYLLEIDFDNFGEALAKQFSGLWINFNQYTSFHNLTIQKNLEFEIFGEYYNIANAISYNRNKIFNHFCQSKITEISIRRHLVVIKRLLKITENGKDLERKFAGWMMRFINTSRWAHSVSFGISFNQTRFNFALDHLEKEPSPDLFSSLLKTAVIYHVIGDADNETKLLDYVGKRSSEYFGHVCRCWNFNVSVNKDLATWLLEEKPTFQTVTEKCLAFCVMFLPTEKPLTFGPLIYEFYRHVGSSKHFITDQYFGFWHECCVIDCFPLTLFLLYLKNKRNQKLQNAIRNLETLKWVILNLKDLGHRETACNILAWCYFNEGDHIQGFKWLKYSLQLRSEMNAAKLHLAIAFYRLYISPNIY